MGSIMEQTAGAQSGTAVAGFNGSLVQIRFRCWTGEKQTRGAAKLDEESGTDKDWIKMIKQLIDPIGLKNIRKIQNACRSRVRRYSLAFPMDNVLFVPNQAKHTVEKLVVEYSERVRDAVNILVFGGDVKLTTKTTKYCKGYASLINEARDKLGTEFTQADYPTVEELEGKFAIELLPWFDLSPAAGQEDNALDGILAQFKQEATTALKAEFFQIVNRIATTCTIHIDPVTGQRSRPALYDTMLEDLSRFMGLIGDLNVGKDEAIMDLVGKVKGIMTGSNLNNTAAAMGRLRHGDWFRDQLAVSFKEVADQFQGNVDESTERAAEEGLLTTGRRIRVSECAH